MRGETTRPQVLAAACVLWACCALPTACSDSVSPTSESSQDAADDVDAALDDTVAVPVDATADAAPPADVSLADAAAVDAPDSVADVALAQDVTSPVVPGPCPIAVLNIAEGSTVTPQTVLHLSGLWSIGSNGTLIGTYHWSVTQPPGSLQQFLANDNLPSPTFLPAVVGTYTFCLDVIDETGLNTCVKTCEQVNVVPSDALHVQLLWHTPADKDEGDSGPNTGADLDLHVATSKADGLDLDCDGEPDPWFGANVDCFWFTPQLAWGPLYSDLGDATMSLDDTDGAGPENFDSEKPLGTMGAPHSYALGVHSWNDHGFGPSVATVSVFVHGDLVYQTPGVELHGLDLWNIGLINWPNSATGFVGVSVVDPCYQTPGSQPGDVCKPATQAKAWQPKGPWCIQPCYVSPGQPYGAQGKSSACAP